MIGAVVIFLLGVLAGVVFGNPVIRSAVWKLITTSFAAMKGVQQEPKGK